MTPEYLGRIRALYETALSRDDSERAAFLEHECKGDEAIRRDVDLLLAARQRVPLWLNQPALVSAPARESPASLSQNMEGRKLGGYDLIREIGRGGMASPEQVNGAPITTLTDVYSLGVILYELLTGHRPYHLLRAAAREMARVLSEEEPTRPSVVVATTEERATPESVSQVREGDPIRLRKRLEGDIGCILMTALRKEPVRRYSSPEAFGQDLNRHLEDLPVSAREDTLRYRATDTRPGICFYLLLAVSYRSPHFRKHLALGCHHLAHTSRFSAATAH